ncbi:MAG TPA: GH92 family glycosyl hydrolase [Candidatus Baltobacteraceae bacterium]|nr:GH92 family glycosyl hydrolase [Candidatus Baltobacteraceae bacterium]
MKKTLLAVCASALFSGLFAVPAIAQPASDPLPVVDPFIGTGGTSGTGLVDDFPGATAPFGMLQWSPDTPSQPPSGGYFYRDSAITGFSLTHVSGAGCGVYGDFGVLPVTGAVSDPSAATQAFTHAGEQASPGFYSVHLSSGIDAALTAAPRTGLASFTFPPVRQANLLIETSSDQAGVTAAQAWVAGPDEIDGSASSGGFCGMPNTFTIYFAMRFDRPFASYGAWDEKVVTPGANRSTGVHGGEWVTFDARTERTVKVKAAVSYVSVDGAKANLAALPSWDLDAVRASTQTAWRTLLGRVQIDGGTNDDRRMFYTALYHALLSPTLYSDADGRYRGFDGNVHRNPPGHAEYTNFSGWDIYRTQAPLMSLLAPHETGDMVQSLVHASQQGGWMPKWPVANGYTGVMGGDSADAIIAGAYAFGARGFDRAAALREMVKSATDTTSPPGQGWYYPRPGLSEYLRYGYVVNTHTTSVSPVPNAASETLEYAIDDFSIAQLAHNIGNEHIYRLFLRRSQNWSQLFDRSTGLIAPRDSEGAFMQTPLTENGQSGFQEGNAAQYTWMVPQALGSLVDALGGSQNAIARLDQFFTKLDAGQNEPFAWFGNEPTLASPWTYLYAGAPYKTQALNRAAMNELYAPTPDGIPGNDDLGTMSAWWVWNAMGLYPINPSVPVLLLEGPLFAHVSITSPSGKTIVIDAPQASRATPYVQSLTINGRPSDRLWVTLPSSGTVYLQYVLGAQPNAALAASPASAPPNYATGIVRFPASTSTTLALQTPSITLAPGQSAPLVFGPQVSGTQAGMRWNVKAPQGIVVDRGSGEENVIASGSVVHGQVTVSESLAPGLYDVEIHARAMNGATIPHVTSVVRVQRPGEPLRLLYAANFSEDSVTPIDPRTLAYGNPIPVGSRPGDLAISRDGARLYTANQSSNDVSVVDTNAGKTIATVKMGNVPAGIRLTPDGSTLWVSNYADGTLQAIDVATLKPRPAFAVGSHPEEVQIAPDGSRIYVVLQGQNALAVVDAAASRVLATVPVGRHPLGVALSPDGKRAFVSADASDDVTAIDTTTLQPVKTIPVGKTPQGLSVSPQGALLYVANAGSSQVTPIDLTTLTAGKPIMVGNAPFGVVFDESGKYAFTVNSGDGDGSVIDVARAAVANSVPLGSFPIAIGRP